MADSRRAPRSRSPVRGRARLSAGDFDNDGRTDLFVAGEPAHRLLGQRADGTFGDLSAAAPSAGSHRRRRRGDAGRHRSRRRSGCRDWRSRAARAQQRKRHVHRHHRGDRGGQRRRSRFRPLSPPISTIAATSISWSCRRACRRRSTATCGTGASATSPPRSAFPAADAYSAVAAGDVNKDELTDFFLGRQQAPGLLVMSRGVDRFDVIDAPPATAGAAAAMFVDYDNDGLLDLLVVTAAGPRLWRRVADRWTDVSARAFAAPLRESGGMTALAMGDLDGDGDTDAIVRLSSGQLRVLDNDGGAKQSIAARAARTACQQPQRRRAHESTCAPAASGSGWTCRRGRPRPHRRTSCSASGNARPRTSFGCCGPRGFCRPRPGRQAR